jgi:N-acetyl-anhydromuramyl-L-alanine amidase AmpD
VLTHLPAILKFLMENYPQAHDVIVANVHDSAAAKEQMKTGQGPNFDWHSGP